MTARLVDIEAWIAARAVRLIVIVLIVVATISAALLYLLLDEQARLQGVTKAGPCRALGIRDAECRRQARLILAACADQPRWCARRYGIRVIRVPREP